MTARWETNQNFFCPLMNGKHSEPNSLIREQEILLSKSVRPVAQVIKGLGGFMGGSRFQVPMRTKRKKRRRNFVVP